MMDGLLIVDDHDGRFARDTRGGAKHVFVEQEIAHDGDASRAKRFEQRLKSVWSHMSEIVAQAELRRQRRAHARHHVVGRYAVEAFQLGRARAPEARVAMHLVLEHTDASAQRCGPLRRRGTE